MIKTQSKDSILRKLIFNESFLLVDRQDKINIVITDEAISFTINIEFSDEGDSKTTSGDLTDEGKTFNLVLHKWDGQNIELSKPIEFTIKGTNKIVWIKFRTSSNINLSFRNFEISIWIQE